jgi:ribosomal protein S18 acetylase RimI-like enzyme
VSDQIRIRPLGGEEEAWACADLMAATDPWITLGRTRDETHQVVTNPIAQTHVAEINDEIVGLLVIATKVPLLGGYVMTLAVHSDHRNRGIGRKLLAFAEDLIFRTSPNVFLCVSSFNTDAQRFYERLGYTRIGELTDFIIAGAGEILMRKTLGPKATFRAQA